MHCIASKALSGQLIHLFKGCYIKNDFKLVKNEFLPLKCLANMKACHLNIFPIAGI